METNQPTFKNQQTIFVNEVLPDLFYRTPEQFLKLLAHDGTQFLSFYWVKAGDKLTPTQRVNSFGLNYEIRQPARKKTVALITLPAPHQTPEAYFVALAYRPDRVMPLSIMRDTTKQVSLELILDKEGQPATRLVHWNWRMKREVIGRGPMPVVEDFYQVVLELIKD
jgi:hypothetical protein